MPKITKTLVTSEPVTAGTRFVWDVEIKGFGLQIHPSGVKSFVFQYRNAHGRTRRGTLGKAAESFTAEQARKKAKAWRSTIEGGGDPLASKRADRDALTVTELLDLWMASARFRERATITQDTDRGRVERHLKPTLGKKIVDKLTAEDVRKAFAAIRDGKTACNVKTKARGRAIVTGGEGAARMAIRVFRAAVNWAIAESYATHNPAMHVKIGTDGRRAARIRTGKEYEGLFKAIDKLENERQIRGPVADAIRVLALTGARRNEIAALRWEHVDLQSGVLRLPPSSHKTGSRTGEDRVIGLPTVAQAIITRQPKSGGYVFAASKGDGVICLSKPWRQIRKAAKLPEGVVLHTLRHSLATMMATQGAEAAQIMATLGHKQLSTSQRYIDLERDARAALVQKHTAGIAAALTGKKPAKVESLKRRRSNDK